MIVRKVRATLLKSIVHNVDLVGGQKCPPSYDPELELICDRCDVKISDTEKAYEHGYETICEECEVK